MIFVDCVCIDQKDRNYEADDNEEMMMMMSLSLSLSLEEMGREHDGSNDGVVLAGEVVHLLLLGVGVAPQQLVVLDHLALVADCLHVVLVVVARLKEGTLQQLTVSALSLCVPITNRLAFHWKTTKQKLWGTEDHDDE